MTDFPLMHREDYLNGEFVERMKRYYRREKLESMPKKLAVIGIDLQKIFLDSKFHAYLPSSPRLIENLLMFYEFAKGEKIPVILTRHCHEFPEHMARWWNSEMPCESEATEIHPGLMEFGDFLVEKRTYDAFHGTNLDGILRNLNVETVIITGVMTHLCCETTARNAFVRGYNVIFPIDGTITQNSELHEGTLRAISHGFAAVPTLREIIEWLR